MRGDNNVASGCRAQRTSDTAPACFTSLEIWEVEKGSAFIVSSGIIIIDIVPVLNHALPDRFVAATILEKHRLAKEL